MAFNHFDEQGRAVMVDISAKIPTLRIAVAAATVRMQPATLAAIGEGRITKGDVFAVARLAGIAAAKRTPELIPLSHPLAIHFAGIEFAPDEAAGTVVVTATVKALERTGMEMEAMMAATLAALTIYDMCKGADKGITIEDIRLLYKEGGKSGVFRREQGDKEQR